MFVDRTHLYKCVSASLRLCVSALIVLAMNYSPAAEPVKVDPFPLPPGAVGAEQLYRQTDDDVLRKSWGCVNCHQGVRDMHDRETVKLGCCDCHGGDPTAPTKETAHVAPSLANAWPTSGNPVRSYALLNHESPDFIRFVNPGDLRVAHLPS